MNSTKKKKTKIIIVISILLIIAILILGVNELSKYKTFTATIINIEDETIVVDCSSDLIPYVLYEGSSEEKYGHKVSIEDNIYVTAKYRVYTNNVVIRDSDGHKIGISELEVGDSIMIINRKGGEKVDLVSYPESLDNIKLIKVLNKSSSEILD